MSWWASSSLQKNRETTERLTGDMDNKKRSVSKSKKKSNNGEGEGSYKTNGL